jgi:hypothetical protein
VEEKNNPIASGTGRVGSGHVDFPHGGRAGAGTREVGQPDVQLPAEGVFARFWPFDQPAEPLVQPAQSVLQSAEPSPESII